jgi:regulator of protease activity HflC (stomatin/prohibitin superfamily)
MPGVQTDTLPGSIDASFHVRTSMVFELGNTRSLQERAQLVRAYRARRGSAMIAIPIEILVLLALAVSASIRIAKEYERGVVFRLDRLIGLKGPGLFLILPGIDRVTMVDLRVITLEVPPQEVITSDAQVLANAAEIISTQPAAQALRYMQTLLDMRSNQNSTIVFPIPIELIKPLLAEPVPMRKAAMRVKQAMSGSEAELVNSPH